MSGLKTELFGALGLELLLEARELREELGEGLGAVRGEEARGVGGGRRADGQAGHHGRRAHCR